MKFWSFSFSMLMCIGFILPASTQPLSSDNIIGSLMGGCIGDALGKPTEFINTPTKILQTYPGGIKSFKDLEQFGLLERSKTGQLYAPYTDDTAMARVTMQVLLQARQNNMSLNDTMSTLAHAYIADMQDKNGWTKPGRAPGNCCLKNVRKLERVSIEHGHQNPPLTWWQAGGLDDGGCGSVMRAHVFGLVFADNPEKAALWAAEHSKITHGAPLALAACAAMAIGTALAVQGKDPNTVINTMIKTALKYDAYTAKMIKDATEQAQQLSQSAAPKQYSKILSYYFEYSKPIFDRYHGWAAHEAIAAAAYIFALDPDDIYQAWFLGVHTPGDSDSIASMAGALVGARVGYARLQQVEPDYEKYEGSGTLEEYGYQAARLILKKQQPASGPHVACAAACPVKKQQPATPSTSSATTITTTEKPQGTCYWKWAAGIAALLGILYIFGD